MTTIEYFSKMQEFATYIDKMIALYSDLKKEDLLDLKYKLRIAIEKLLDLKAINMEIEDKLKEAEELITKGGTK